VPAVIDVRDGERVGLDAFVRAGSDGHEVMLRTRDLSRSGLFLYTRVAHSYPFRVGTTLALELFDHDRALHLTGVVARVVEPGSPESDRFPTGFGVRFANLDAPALDALDVLIERVRSAGGVLY
jgi:PilZ domain